MNSVLDILRGRADYLGEAELARTLGQSVEEMRLALVQLRRQGYEIEEHPELGYRFLAAPDSLLRQEIIYRLCTKKIGKEVHCFDSVGSTNDLAWDLAMQGAPEGTVVLAEEQTAGRGRQGRAWHSPAHVGIYLSCVLRPPLSPPSYWIVTACASVAVCQAIESEAGLKASVKKPNDVLLGGRKVCGILTESRRDALILGIGVGVNNTWDDFPEDLRETATSIRIEAGRRIDRIGLLRRILQDLDRAYEQLGKDEGSSSVEQWNRLQG